jgi:hypothetical protein
MPIESVGELEEYLVQVLGAAPNVARTVAGTAVFRDRAFRGAGQEFTFYLDELRGRDIRNLLRELGRPRILWDHYPGADGRCAPRDNFCCAVY